MLPRPIIFDCDPGDDDAIALLMAMASPKNIDILGITTSCGNVPIDLTFSNARKICELGGRPDIKVFKGCSEPLLKKPFYADFIHGKTGLDGHALKEPQTPPEKRHAVDFIIETLLAHPQKVTLAVTGPMTNIALALIKEPSLKNNIDQVIMMGGARTEGGNVRPCAEFNMFVDPHAAYKVFNTLNSIVMVSLDISHKVTLTENFFRNLKALRTDFSETIYPILAHAHEADKRTYDLPGRAIHDACVSAYLLNPTLFSGRTCNVTVETANDQTLGQTIVHWYPMHNQKRTPNCYFLHEVDSKGVLELIFDKLKILSDAYGSLEQVV